MALDDRKQTLAALRGRIIVSCQPVENGPMDSVDVISCMGRAAICGGAGGLRIQGGQAVRRLAAESVPIIGIVKRSVAGSQIRITPYLEDVDELIAAGAAIVAYDATQQPRPVSTAEIVARIRGRGALAMADCACLQDGERALAEGADILGTTMCGYAYEQSQEDAAPALDLVAKFATLRIFVIAEGRYRTPSDAAAAIAMGADAVVVGSAITRIEYITQWFSSAITQALKHSPRPDEAT